MNSCRSSFPRAMLACICVAWACVLSAGAWAQDTVSPSSLSWGAVAIGNSGGPKPVTVTNIGTGPSTISAVIGTNFAIYKNTCAGTPLAASASCTITLLFRPTATGTLTATLTVTDGASNTTQTVALSGFGTGSQPTGVSVSPASLSFGSITSGSTSPPQTITVSNAASAPVTLSPPSINGGPFANYSTTCGSSLPAYTNCATSVIFQPPSAGPASATWSIVSNNTTSLSVALSGSGADPATGSATVSPASLIWGIVTYPNTSGQKSITLTNTGSTPIGMGSITFTGTNGTLSTEFNLFKSTCSSGLAASASCTLNVTFKPAGNGTRTGTMSIADTASNSPQLVSLSGTGAGVTTPFTITPTSVSLLVGAQQPFTASASATWTASCGSISTSGLYTAPLSPGSCTVTATPTASGNPATATVTVTASLAVSPTTVNLHALNTIQFTASTAATWTSSCGTISSSGLFTAPAASGACTVTATSSSGPSSSATATVNVDVVNYTGWKGGGGLTGAQTDELALTPANVSSTAFGLLWGAKVDGWITAQPLYMNGLTINGATHNVVFVCTNNDSVYAFDGDTGAQLWQVSLIPGGAAAVTGAEVGYNSSQQQFGILSTPVIDPMTNTLYVVTETAEQNATVFPHRLHALDVTTGQEKFGGPVLISNPQMAPVLKLQRAALALAGGNVYVGIGSLQDRTPFNGLLFGFNAATLVQQSVWVATPTGLDGGVWMGGAPPSVDENGNIYVATGNGTFDGVSNFGEAVVKLNPSLQVLDYFAPYNNSTLTGSDLDLGAGDAMLIPDQNGAYPHELIVCGKPTPVYVLNRDNLGQVGTSDNVIQEVNSQIGVVSPPGATSCLTAPAMWGQNVYFGGKSDVLKMFTLNSSTGMLSTTPVSQGTLKYGYPGADPVISANGASNGIVWTVDTNTNTLQASDATNLANAFFSSVLGGGAFHWVVPTVVNGHVYVGGKTQLFAFGLKH